MKKIAIATGFALSVSFASLVTHAGTGDDEKQLLIKTAAELEYVLTLIEQAESKDNKKGNVSLDYDALKRDVETIKDALKRHASRPQRTPRSIDAMRNNAGYVR
jgi:RAQPRD family integrative conjugative element protein